MVAWGFCAVFTGIWLRVMLPHWRLWALGTAWLALLAAIMTLEPLGARLDQWYQYLSTNKGAYRGPSTGQWGDGIAGVFLTVGFAACGMAIGGLLLRIGPRYWAWRFGRMRAGVRKLRQA